MKLLAMPFFCRWRLQHHPNVCKLHASTCLAYIMHFTYMKLTLCMCKTYLSSPPQHHHTNTHMQHSIKCTHKCSHTRIYTHSCRDINWRINRQPWFAMVNVGYLLKWPFCKVWKQNWGPRCNEGAAHLETRCNRSLSEETSSLRQVNITL